jgi:PAS domain S-box-containing protein/diguanylate cyclase (GGDEF)-like protein
MQRDDGASEYHNGLWQFEKLLDVLDDPCGIVDEDYRYLWVNRAYLARYGLERDKVEGYSVPKVLGETYFTQEVKPRMDRCFAGERQCFETQREHHQQGVRKLRVCYYPMQTPADAKRRVGVVITDLTHIRQVEADMHVKEQVLRQLAQIVEQSPAAVVVTDLAGRIEYVNPAFERSSAYSREALNGNTPALIKSGKTPDAVYRHLWQTITAGQVWAGELENRRQDGTPYWEYEVISPLTDDQGAMTHYVAIKQEITALKRAESELKSIAFEDALTGLCSRIGFTQQLQQRIKQNGWQASGVVVMVNIVGQRDINDAYGYEVGDHLLVEIGHRLTEQAGEAGLAGRIGGDEFSLFLRPSTDMPLETHLRSLLEALSVPFTLDGVAIDITFGLGYTRLGATPRGVENLLREAERALFRQRAEASSAWVAYDTRFHQEARQRIELTRELRYAIHHDQLELHFQPKVDLATGKLVACEALLRWNHPERGLISPGVFIPLAEQSQLILPIGDWVLRRACQHLRDWRDAGLEPVRVAVNVSMVQFKRGGFARYVQTVLEQSGVRPSELSLEVTESVFEQASDVLHEQMRMLRDMGVRLALDDFGTGYSSLLYLQHYPFDEIKIDQGFVFHLLEDSFSRHIVETVVKLAEALGAEVIAEGIESAAVGEALLAMNCPLGQGFFYSMPLETEDFQWLLEQRSTLPLTEEGKR